MKKLKDFCSGRHVYGEKVFDKEKVWFSLLIQQEAMERDENKLYKPPHFFCVENAAKFLNIILSCVKVLLALDNQHALHSTMCLMKNDALFGTGK